MARRAGSWSWSSTGSTRCNGRADAGDASLRGHGTSRRHAACGTGCARMTECTSTALHASSRTRRSDMIGQILKAAAYAKAPRLTFTSLHPTTALRLRALPLEMRYGYGTRLAMSVALMAFPLGVIVGVLIGRRR